MIDDLPLARSLQKLILNRDPENSSYTSIASEVINGIRHITFTSIDNEIFRDSYTLIQKIADITNMDGRKETWANPHFIDDFETIKPLMMRKIEEDPKLPVVLSGHGVAGAIAVLAGYYLTMRHYNLAQVVTFGAPAALNHKKLKHGFICPLQQITTQYVLPNDRMPRMFRWTKYCSIDRSNLNFICKGSEIDNYIDGLKWVNV